MQHGTANTRAAKDGNYMSELEIRGSKKYLKYLKKHLEKEHPSTKGKIKIEKKRHKR